MKALKKQWYNQLPWWGWLISFIVTNQAGIYMMRMQDPVVITIGACVGTFGLYSFIALIVQLVNHKKRDRKKL